MMSITENSRQSYLIPSFLYSSSMNSSTSNGIRLKESSSPIMVASPSEKIKMYSPAFYAACTTGGMLSCGVTHTAVTPLDVVKCNMQVLYCSF